jgi:hypothetical protein
MYKRRVPIVVVLVVMLLSIVPAAAIASQPTETLASGWCICTIGAKSWPCKLRFERYGVKWLPVLACIPPGPSGRIDGLASLTSQRSTGNKGGCGGRGLDTCTVTDAGKGYVALSCDYYTVPERFNTRLKWRIGTPVTLWGCIALDESGAATELVAPFTLKKR